MTARLIAPPTTLAVKLADAKTSMRVDGSYMDALITIWVLGVTAKLEHEIGQCLMPQTWEVTLDTLPEEVAMPHPVCSITSFTYLDGEGVRQTLDPALYRVRRTAYESVLTAAPGASWPSVLAPNGGIVITVICGIGETPADIPANVQLYILAKLVEQFDPITRMERDTVQSHFIDHLLDACKTYR